MNSPPFEYHDEAGLIWETYRTRGLTPNIARDFRRIVCRYYRTWGRDLPWRQTYDPYRILVSEFMLQQTRVETVQTFYPRFIARYPDFSSLARSTFPEVLQQWKGLGYNRRARALLETGRRVYQEYEGILPSDEAVLCSFPGVGKATSAAICAFAFHQPVILLETNIRTVFIHFFFRDQETVTDRDILPLVKAVIPASGAREWYYALMDYGVMLKKEVGNLNRRMARYRTQSRFAGSDRELRGRILSILLEQPHQEEEIRIRLGSSADRLNLLLRVLEREGLLTRQGDSWTLTR